MESMSLWSLCGEILIFSRLILCPCQSDNSAILQIWKITLEGLTSTIYQGMLLWQSDRICWTFLISWTLDRFRIVLESRLLAAPLWILLRQYLDWYLEGHSKEKDIVFLYTMNFKPMLFFTISNFFITSLKKVKVP